ncbi:MAG: hypothetical protein KF817_08405 [Phycisphaeraceae bacterium]|nr:hypothetical protein [Phycisphaeraceae bacterium]
MIAAIAVSVGACRTPRADRDGHKAQSSHQVSAFTYQPINPLTVWLTSGGPEDLDGIGAEHYRDAMLTDLTNDATRVALAKRNAKGTLSFGPVTGGADGELYTMVVDYIKYMTISVPVRVFEVTANEKGGGATATTRLLAMEATPSAEKDGMRLRTGEDAGHQRVLARVDEGDTLREVFAGSMPLYIGIGVRVRADYEHVRGEVKVSGLPGLSAEASAGNIRGTLSVQTLGISGKDITPLLRIPSDLSIASIQSAIETAASVKLKIYDNATLIQPMIIGFESPVTEGDIVAELTSFIYSRNIRIQLKTSQRKNVKPTELLWLKWLTEHDARGDDQRVPSP